MDVCSGHVCLYLCIDSYTVYRMAGYTICRMAGLFCAIKFWWFKGEFDFASLTLIVMFIMQTMTTQVLHLGTFHFRYWRTNNEKRAFGCMDKTYLLYGMDVQVVQYTV